MNKTCRPIPYVALFAWAGFCIADEPARTPESATVVNVGRPAGGGKVVSDLVVFDDLLWMIASDDPLGASTVGARIYAYDATANAFALMLDAGDSEGGFVRGRVIGGRLFVPDSDVSGPPEIPGRVFIFDSADGLVEETRVPGAVHNFDVVSIDGGIYASSGLNAGWRSGLHRYDEDADTWSLVSSGAYGRLRWMQVLSANILAGWWHPQTVAAPSGPDMLMLSPESDFSQRGVKLVDARRPALVVALERLGEAVYVTLYDLELGQHRMGRIRGGGTNGIDPLTGPNNAVLLDYVRHDDGVIYAVGLYLQGDDAGSAVFVVEDDRSFRPIWYELGNYQFVPELFGINGQNLDSRASIASYRGALYCGSARSGELVRVDVSYRAPRL